MSGDRQADVDANADAAADTDAGDDERRTRPDCPNCGQPVGIVTVIGPTDAIAAPCGCRVPADALAVPRLE
ncbi:hypothetical protein [Natrinema salifodinae]|uniref:Small CPxCG-related zinc finger protein n=1 Tax=Natrinema salifodinae TaxID=1202768 RepID=A0A1I0MJE4_9EURY|nr:hypothetical protein [Natrinema salifodinae]SEV87946.1 hypothetical protein SAMN05216285_0992 [Natrinema salifodinae]